MCGPGFVSSVRVEPQRRGQSVVDWFANFIEAIEEALRGFTDRRQQRETAERWATSAYPSFDEHLSAFEKAWITGEITTKEYRAEMREIYKAGVDAGKKGAGVSYSLS